MRKLSVLKRKMLLLLVAALMVATMFAGAVASQDDDAPAWSARALVCAEWDDESVCIKWRAAS